MKKSDEIIHKQNGIIDHIVNLDGKGGAYITFYNPNGSVLCRMHPRVYVNSDNETEIPKQFLDRLFAINKEKDKQEQQN